ncbi:Retrovirus-related Pol polyprotein from transposon TNT 1-94 [Capsicum annuum]|nr:Retrovirus-related Pol polyprotein from transposon TNT 1-94 [Capsicum annuum]
MLTELPAGMKALLNKWVFRIKVELDGKRRFKARLVVKGYSQRKGINYAEIFSPIVKLTTIRILLSIIASENLHLEQMDVKIAFLHEDLDKEIYMQQPEGFVVPGSSMKEINSLKASLSSEFEMKDLGAAKQILGMRISRDRSAGTLNLSQEQYVEKVLTRFRIINAKPRTTPLVNHIKLSKEQSPKTTQEQEHIALVLYASAVGSLMYAMVCTRPDIAHTVVVVSRYMANPGKKHWKVVKWLLRYLKGTSSTSLCFGNGEVILQGFVDADLSGDVDSSMSTSRYIYIIGSTAISWMSRLQKCVVLSSTEAEFIAIAEAGKEMIWLVDYLKELGKKQLKKIFYTDSHSAIQLVKNPVYHSKTKHIRRRYHFTRRAVEKGDMCLEKMEGTKNLADILTTCVDVDVYERLIQKGRKPTFAQLLITQAVSAVWHGLYPGYIIFFVQSALMIAGSRDIYRWQQATSSGQFQKMLVFMNFVYTLLVLNYSAVGFMVLSLHETLTSYGSVYYIGTIVPILVILLGKVTQPAKPVRSRAKKEE